MYIIMLGTPGSGKGTVGKILAKELNITHVSTGDIFRAYTRKDDELGKELESYTVNGLLVPDELTIKIISRRLEEPDVEHGAILDGYPRTKKQAEELDIILAQLQRRVDVAINLEVEDKIILDRILKRRICTNPECREIYNIDFKPPRKEDICDKCGSTLEQRLDDNEEIFKQRLEIYKQTSPDIINYYKENGVLLTKYITEENHKTSSDVASELVEHFKYNS